MQEKKIKVWRVNIKIGTRKLEDMEEIQKQCLLKENEKEGKGYIAIGWAIDTKELDALKDYQDKLKNNNINSDLAEKMKNEYQNLAAKIFNIKSNETNNRSSQEKNGKLDGRLGLVYASNNIFIMSKGDICFTRTKENIYYIGRVIDDYPTYAKFDVDGVLALEASWLRKIYWYKLGREDDVPSNIVGWFMERRERTITQTNDVNKIKLANSILNEKENRHDKINKIAINQENYLSTLSPHMLEEIVCLYLQMKLNYCIYISSWRKTTKLFEYILVDKNTHKKAYVQTKVDAEINLKDYNISEYDDATIFVISGAGYKNDEHKSNIIKLNEDVNSDGVEYKKDLYEFYKNNIDLFGKGMQVEMKYYDFE